MTDDFGAQLLAKIERDPERMLKLATLVAALSRRKIAKNKAKAEAKPAARIVITVHADA